MAIRWRNSSKFLEDGVMQNTAYRFYRQISEHTAAKFMPGTQPLRDAAEMQLRLQLISSLPLRPFPRRCQLL